MQKPHKGSNKSGFRKTFAVLGFVALIAIAMLVPNFKKARQTSGRPLCAWNLANIDGAKQQWAVENRADLGTVVTVSQLVGSDSYLKNMPICPKGGNYSANAIGTPPTCSIGSDVPGHALTETQK